MFFISRLQPCALDKVSSTHPDTPCFKRTFIKKILYRISVISIAVFFAFLSAGCDDPYGKIGDADKTTTLSSGDAAAKSIVQTLSGIWYSHYAGTGRLDGFRIGKWSDFDKLMKASGKTDLFPNMEEFTYTSESGSNEPADDDYFVFYDDTVYGETDDGIGGNGGWDGLSTRYIGIIRAVNIFNDNQNRGAVIIEYLRGCAPGWLDRWTESKSGGRPFFGVYYRVLDSNTVQMANAVDLAALYAGKRYYTEKATLKEAIAANTVENEAEFISWGVVIPQDKEK